MSEDQREIELDGEKKIKRRTQLFLNYSLKFSDSTWVDPSHLIISLHTVCAAKKKKKPPLVWSIKLCLNPTSLASHPHGIHAE